MSSQVHPMKQDDGAGGDGNGHEANINQEEIRETSPAEIINVATMDPGPITDEPKTGSKSRQVGIGLENLKQVDFVKIRQTNRDMEDFANVPNNYDIERRDKQKIFYGMESTDADVRAKVESSTIASQAFGLKLIDLDDGSEILEIQRQGLNDTPTVVYKTTGKRKEVVGAIVLQFGHSLVPAFTIFGKDESVIMELVGPTAYGFGKHVASKTTTFEVFKPDKKTKIGSIVKDGDIFEENKLPSTEEECIEVAFEDKNLDNLSKALVISTGFVLDFTQFKNPSNIQKLASLICFRCT